MSQVLTDALSTHTNLTKEQVNIGVKTIMDSRPTEDQILRLALALSYNCYTGILAFDFNFYVDRAITKPALERLSVMKDKSIENLLTWDGNGLSKLTSDERQAALNVAKKELEEVKKNPISVKFDCLPHYVETCDGPLCVKERWTFSCKVPQYVDFPDKNEKQNVYRIYTATFKDLIQGLALGKNPVTQESFDPASQQVLTNMYSVLVRAAAL